MQFNGYTINKDNQIVFDNESDIPPQFKNMVVDMGEDYKVRRYIIQLEMESPTADKINKFYGI